MIIPTEPIGSIPRPPRLIEAIAAAGNHTAPELDPLYEDAIADTIARFEATGSPVITDGEQRKYHNFWTYSVDGLVNTAPDGFKIPFAAGHVRHMPRLTAGPFRYRVSADRFLDMALRYAHVPVKQAVISPSALSLMYPAEPIPGYAREEFIDDLLGQHESEVRACLRKGAHKVQIDFTEARLAIKIEPTGHLLNSFIDLNNLALSRFTAQERQRIGIHTCPGGDRDSTHSSDVDYAELLPSLFELRAGNFYVALAGEPDPARVLKIIRTHMKPDQRIFVGVVAPIDPHIETSEQVRDRVLQAAEYIPLEQLGTTDDCGIFAVLRRHLHQPRHGFRENPLAGAWNGAGRRHDCGPLMPSNDDEEKQLRSVALQNAQAILLARQRADRELLESREALERKTLELSEANRSLRESEARYRTALAAGRMGTWETDLVNRTRLWTEEGMALFGISLAGGRGQVGGENDEYQKALHPDDRHLMHKFHELADRQDSFTSEYRTVHPDGTVLWLRGRGQVIARGPDGKAQRMVSIVTDVTERKAAEDHIQFLMHEISHRSKNLLMVIQSIARRTARSAGSIAEFERRFERRLQGLAASHDVLVSNDWQGAPLADLVRRQLAPFAEIQGSRIELAGPHVIVTAEAAQALGLAIHELATNAIKYGALSVPTGRVGVFWSFEADAGAPWPLTLNWVEQGGPQVTPPRRHGFGHVVIGEMVERSLGGKVAMEFAAEGLRWGVVIPASNLVSEAHAGD